MTIPQDEIARLTAAKFSQTNPNLPQLVENVIANPEAKYDVQTYDMGTAINLASLIVSIASFTWAIYQEFKKGPNRPDKKLIARKTKLKFGRVDWNLVHDCDRIIEVIVEETFNYKDT